MATVVIGGGLAGIAAAIRLAEAGVEVTLLEKRTTLGGRACSFRHPDWSTPIDNAQHVLLGCCTHQLDLYQRLGVAEQVTWHDRLTFVDSVGRRGTFGAAGLPHPLGLLPGLFAVPGLTWSDRLALGLAMTKVLLASRRLEALSEVSFERWLGRLAQAPGARAFFSLMLTSVLNADADRVAARYAVLFFSEGMLRHPRAFHLGVPTVPLGELHDTAARRHLAELGARVVTGQAGRVEFDPSGERVVSVRVGDEVLPCEQCVVAAQWHQLAFVLHGPRALGERAEAPGLEPEPIIGVHLGFAQPVECEPVLGLLNGDIDWIFRHDEGHRLSVVVSAASGWDGLSQSAMIARAIGGVRAVLPDLPEPVRTAACRERRATFIPAPGSDCFRPGPAGPSDGLWLAGAWTDTGWPSTMESAVRSGYRAASEVLQALGCEPLEAVPNLPAAPLVKLFLPS